MYNGPHVPAGYAVPESPYRVRGNVAAHIDFLVFSITPADYAGDWFELQLLGPNGILGPVVRFEFYEDPAPPPVAPDVPINVTGLATLSAITVAISIAVQGAGFRVATNAVVDGATIFQPYPGTAGNVAIAVSDALAGVLEFNGVGGEGETAFFFGGQDFSVPLLWGKLRAFGLGFEESPSTLVEE